MITKNIITLLIIIFAIGVATLYFYKFSIDNSTQRSITNSNISERNDKIISGSDTMNTTKSSNYVHPMTPSMKPSMKPNTKPKSILKHKKKSDSHKSNKKVKFNDKMEYVQYINNRHDLNKKIEIDLNDDHDDPDKHSERDEYDGYDEHKVTGVSEQAQYTPTSSKTKIIPSNLDQTDPTDTWDSSFGLPLMSAGEKRDYFYKMQENHKKLEKSMGEFTDYQMDRSTVIKTDTSIDPFKPSHHSASLENQTIQDIYDSKVSVYKAKPKKILKKTKSETTYKHESELNGGNINGTKGLHGFDGIGDSFKAASFGNEF